MCLPSVVRIYPAQVVGQYDLTHYPRPAYVGDHLVAQFGMQNKPSALLRRPKAQQCVCRNVRIQQNRGGLESQPEAFS